MKYNHSKIERKWQKKWLEEKTYEPDFEGAKRPFYNLMMFPYPSAEGLHVGNMYAFTGSDIYGRYQRMRGHDVFEPIGLDGFGIHSENYALKVDAHPAQQAKISEKRFYKQLESIGNGFAWEEKLETYDPEYYRWTQWIFIQMFKRGLAYRKKQPVNWCPSCKTVLADEQVINGRCERCNTEVIKKELEQWFFKITDYAERLLDNLEKIGPVRDHARASAPEGPVGRAVSNGIDWSEKVKIAQRNWIGRSEGAILKFEIRNSKFEIDVFTTRPDTLAGATFLVLAPEHFLIKNLESRIQNLEEVETYIKEVRKKTEQERQESREKTGVELKGVKAINPLTKEEIPVWVADYILASYGTGAIMAVPAHDERDFEFARKYNLSIREVVLREFGQKKEGAIFRDSVAAVITRLSDKKILVIFNRKSGEYEIPGGGRDGNENDQETLSREIREETGYVDFEIKEYLGQIATNFFAVGRRENRTKHQKAYHVVLVSEKGVPLKPDTHEDFESQWLEPQDTIKKLDSNIHGCYESEFIKRFLDSRLVCFAGNGELISAGKFSGMDSEKAKWGITKFVGGEKKINYKLRDWLISRQRYWGPPIPLVFCENCKKQVENSKFEIRNSKLTVGELENPGWIPVAEEDLPVKLPNIKDFRPTGTGQSPLASVKSFYETKCPRCGGPARRETDVSDTFLDSSWYYLAYLVKGISDFGRKVPWGPRPSTGFRILDFRNPILKNWIPVDMYIGGAEHSVLHLLYSRFLAMVFHDWKLTDFEEPFTKFRAHGLLIKEGAKMSKSKGNVVNPDEYIKKFGADTLRMYLMFLAPFEQGGDFRDQAVMGVHRFLNRVWNLITSLRKTDGLAETPILNSEKLLHQTVKKVTEDIENLRYNTAISALMILLKELENSVGQMSNVNCQMFLKLLAPFAPHLTEELWEQLGYKTSIHKELWPTYDDKLIVEDDFELVVQVNGKLRGTIKAKKSISQETAEELAKTIDSVKNYLKDKKIKKIIFIRDRLLNFIV